MSASKFQPWLHRFCAATAVVALLPIVVGALVTTLGAGMAFPDWPSSDGHSMLAYPWLQSAGDKFVEHGHRLAGMVIGFFSIVLALIAWRLEDRRWARGLAFLVLASVVAQGLIGGFRVLADERMAALVHGTAAALVFTLITAVTAVTGRRWIEAPQRAGSMDVSHVQPLVAAAPIVILLQYVLGGMVRHLGLALHEHLVFAFVALLTILVTAIAAMRTRVPAVRNAAWLLLAIVLLQILLGAGAWATRFGIATVGYVAVQHSPMQLTLRTAHTVVGMLLLASSVNLALRVFRQQWGVRVGAAEPSERAVPGAMTMAGGGA